MHDIAHDGQLSNPKKRVYSTPTIRVQGRVEELTRWIGGNWGEFFGGQGSGYNPWARPGAGS